MTTWHTYSKSKVHFFSSFIYFILFFILLILSFFFSILELAAASAESAYGIMSSFRPANSAKLYASPEDMKNVGYRSHSLPGSTSSRSHLRKSHSLRSPNGASFKPPNGQQASSNGGLTNTNGQSVNGGNQYAQPLKTNRSHSMIGTRENKKKSMNSSSSATNLSGSVPPIPEPDYSLSESENDEGEEDDNDDEEEFEVGESEITKELEKAAAREKLESTRETSGNSNTSGSSSSGSSSLPHSFSVEEIQKVRTQLKSSKSHPNEFLLSQQTQHQLVEDGDNSSSGVSSDQDVPVGPPTGFDDTQIRNDNNNQIITDKENNNPKRMNYSSGMLTRHAVSLAQLPPPIEADAEEQNNDLFVPPPPEFNAGPSGNNGDNGDLVFAPPPQFCDNRQQQRVKIIGAIPKVGNNQVKPPTGRLQSQ